MFQNLKGVFKIKVALGNDNEVVGIEICDKEIIENIIGIVSIKTDKDLDDKKINAKWDVKDDEIKLKIKLK